MKTKFKNLIELFDTYKDEATCKALLAQQRWGNNPACPHCGALKPYVTNRGYKCSSKECYKKFTVTVGTVFENSNLKLRTWFAAMYLISTSKKGISSVQLAEQLNITQKSAWFVLHRVREMLKDNNETQLKGTIEVDETYIGGKRSNKHAHERRALQEKYGTGFLEKTPVVGALERDGRVIAFPMLKAEGNVLKPIVYNLVEKGSTLMTDGHGGYKGLNADYNHVVINHAQGVYVVNKTFHTNSIEGFWSIFKRGIYGIYHSVSPKHLHRYCNEFTFRYNERELKNDKRFFLALQNSDGRRLKFNDLIA
jgi:transposase-like protein